MELLGDVGHVESRSVYLEMVFVLVQERCMVCAERTTGSKIVLDAPDGTPRCVGLVESRFGPFGDSVCVGARSVHGLRHTYRWLRNCFERSRWYS